MGGCRHDSGDFRMSSPDRRAGRAAALPLILAALTLGAAGCSHLPRLHAPWAHRPAPPPQPVHELVITDGTGAAKSYPQYWKRNTLVVDLEGISGTGRVVLTPPAGMTWPFRLALRVVPGSVGELDVRADQRLVIPLVASGAKPVDLELAPGLYSRATREISVAWGPVPAP